MFSLKKLVINKGQSLFRAFVLHFEVFLCACIKINLCIINESTTATFLRFAALALYCSFCMTSAYKTRGERFPRN